MAASKESIPTKLPEWTVVPPDEVRARILSADKSRRPRLNPIERRIDKLFAGTMAFRTVSLGQAVLPSGKHIEAIMFRHISGCALSMYIVGSSDFGELCTVIAMCK